MRILGLIAGGVALVLIVVVVGAVLWLGRFPDPPARDYAAEYNALLDEAGPWEAAAEGRRAVLEAAQSEIDIIAERFHAVAMERYPLLRIEKRFRASPVSLRKRPSRTFAEITSELPESCRGSLAEALGVLYGNEADASTVAGIETEVRDVMVELATERFASLAMDELLAGETPGRVLAMLDGPSVRVRLPADGFLLDRWDTVVFRGSQNLGVVLVDRFERAMEARDWERAHASARGMLRLASMSANEPLIQYALTATAIQQMLRYRVIDLIEREAVEAPPEFWEGLVEIVASEGPGEAMWARVVEGERLVGLDAIRAMYEGDLENAGEHGKWAFVICSLGEQYRLLNELYDEWAIWMEREPAELEDDPLRTDPAELADAIPKRCFIASLITPSMRSMMKSRWQHEASWRGVAAVLALEAFKAREGSYPETLAALVPEYLDAVPVDPLDPDGGPLGYERWDGAKRIETTLGYHLWSVGWDGEDDGGVFDDRKASKHWTQTELDIPLVEIE